MMSFHLRVSDCKSLQVSRFLLSMLANLSNNAVVWIVSTRHLISIPPILINPLLTVPRVPIIISIKVTFMFHSFFFSYIVMSRYLSLFQLSFNFTLWSAEAAKSTILQVIFFVDCYKSQRSLCVSFSWTDAGLCKYLLFVWLNLNF